MKVITLKQPWASLVAEGYKKYEFRSWKYHNKETFLIHAGQGVDQEAMKKFEKLNIEFPKSRIVASVKIEECIELNEEENKKIISEDEFVYGNKIDRKGYAWKLCDVKKIDSTKTVKGKQGIWNIEKENY